MFHPFFHDADSKEVEQKKQIIELLVKDTQWPKAKKYVFVSISTGSGFFEIMLLQHLRFFSYGYIIEDEGIVDDVRLHSNMRLTCVPFQYIKGETGCLEQIIKEDDTHYIFMGINMNFYNDWNFFNEFFHWKSNNNASVSYFFLWNPHFHREFHVTYSPDVLFPIPSMDLDHFSHINTGFYIQTNQ